jgi:hypothetical protein
MGECVEPSDAMRKTGMSRYNEMAPVLESLVVTNPLGYASASGE